jgi:hypothetical protein
VPFADLLIFTASPADHAAPEKRAYQQIKKSVADSENEKLVPSG